MSVATQIERLQDVRNQIRNKMVSLGLSTETALLQDLADNLDGVVARGDASATLSTSTRSKTLNAGYYTGGTIKIPNDYFPVNSTNTTATASDVLSGKKFVNTSGNTVTGNIATASSSDIKGVVSVTNPGKITLNTSSTTGSSTGSANASATISKQLYTGSSGVTNSSLGAKGITASAEVALASSVKGSSTIPSTLSTGTVQVSPSTTKTIYSDTSSTLGYIKSFVVDSIKTEEKTTTPSTSKIEVTPSESGKFLTKVTVNAIPNQKDASSVTATVTAGVSNITSINASQVTNGVTVTASASGSTVVPLGYYSTQVSKTPSSSASTTIKPVLAGTNGAIELTAGTSAFTKTSTADYSNGFITSVKVNPTPSHSKTATPSTSKQTISPDSGKLLSSVEISAMPSGAYSASVSAHTITNASASSSVSGTINDITTTTKPTSGTNGTDYYTIIPSLATVVGKSETTAKATIDTAGYLATNNKTSSSSKEVGVSATQGGNRYLSASTFGSETATNPNTTELKSITAGTSTKYIPVNSGYIKSGNITVGPTPSQSKSVTPTMASQTVSPDSGKLLSSVIVNAVPSFSVTLSSNSWSSDSNTTIGKYYYNVSNSNITASNNLYVIPSSASTAQSFGVYAYSQSDGSMQFRAVAQPTSDLEYTVYYLS